MSRAPCLDLVFNFSTGEVSSHTFGRSTILQNDVAFARLLDGQGEEIPHYGKLPLKSASRHNGTDISLIAGLELAKLADLPEDVMTESRRIAKKLSNLEAQKQALSKTTQAVARRTAILSVLISLSGLGDAQILTVLCSTFVMLGSSFARNLLKLTNTQLSLMKNCANTSPSCRKT